MPTSTPTAPTPAHAGRRVLDFDTPFGKIQPVFEGFSLATPGWMHEDSTLPSINHLEPSVRRSPRRQSRQPAPAEQPPPPAVQPTPRRSPRRSAWVPNDHDDHEVEQPTPRRSVRRRTTVARLGFPSMGDSTKESLAESMARSRSRSFGPSEEASPSKPARMRAEGSADRETEAAPESAGRETRTPAVGSRATRQTRASTSTPASNDLYERRLLDSARRSTLRPLPGHDWAEEGLLSSTPAPARAGRRMSFRPSPENELVSALPPTVPTTSTASTTSTISTTPIQPSDAQQSEPRPSEAPLLQTPQSPPPRPTPQQSTPENKFVLPPCVSTRKKRRMASPGRPLFRASTESVEAADSPASPMSAPTVGKAAKPKFLQELSQVLSLASTPEPLVGEAPASVKRMANRASSSSSNASHSSGSSSKPKAKRTVIKIGAGGRIRTSAHAAELVAEQEQSLRIEASMSLDKSESGHRSADQSGEIADWNHDVGSVLPADLVIRRSESLQSSSSHLTRHASSASQSREGTPLSLASLSMSQSSRDSLPPRPQNPTPRTASPRKERFDSDSSMSLPSRPAAPVFNDSSFSTSAPRRPSNPTPKHAHPTHPARATESPAPSKNKLNKSAGDAGAAKARPQPLATSRDRPIKRVPVRKPAAAPAQPAPGKAVRVTAKPGPASSKPAVKAGKPLNKARKRLASDPPQPQPQSQEQPQVFPTRVRNGPPVLTPAKTAKPARMAVSTAQPMTRLPVPSSEERGAKRAKVAPAEEAEPTTPPHVVEALTTPRRHSITLRRTPRRTTPRRTPAPSLVGSWPELGLSSGQGVFTFEHRLRAVEAETGSPALDPPSISYPSHPSRLSRGSYASADEEEEEEEEEENDVDVLSPAEEFDTIRPHGQELSAVLEVTEAEVSALSQRTAQTPLGRLVEPEEFEEKFEEEPTPKAITAAELTPVPTAEPEQDADSSASSGDSSLRRIGEGVLGFLAGLVGTPTPAAPAAPASAPTSVPTAPTETRHLEPQQPLVKPATRAIKKKPVRAKGKENAAAKPRTRSVAKVQPAAKTHSMGGKEGKEDVPRYALATAAARAHEQHPKQLAEKRKRDTGSPQRNVRRKVPAIRPLRSLPGSSSSSATIRSLPDATKSLSRPIRSLPSTRASTRSASTSSSSTSRSSARPGSTVTAFTAAALARLPKPGETRAKASPVKIRDLERARDLAVRKAVFERFHPDDANASVMSLGSPAPAAPARAPLSESSAPNAASSSSKAVAAKVLGPNGRAKNLTVPMSGKTPGKASKLRAASRARFDAKVARRAALKAKEEEERERIRRQVEEEMDRERRRATVIRARPLPEMYRR